MYCYTCGHKFNNKLKCCDKCGKEKIESLDCEEFWRETDFFYKSAKKIMLSSNKFSIIFGFISIIIISFTFLSVISLDFMNILNRAFLAISDLNNQIDNMFIMREAEKAWKDVWCSIIFILIFLFIFIISGTMLIYIARARKILLKKEIS